MSIRASLPVLFAPLLLFGCTEGRDVPAPLAANSDGAAREIVAGFFTAYVAADAPSAVEFMCERDAQSREMATQFILASQAPSSPYRVQTFDVREIEPSWDGKEPVFSVVVAFPRNTSSGEIVQVYRVRAKDACIERFLGGFGVRPPTAPPVDELEEPVVPKEAPPPAPVGPNDEVIEL